jgi:hypothetical protein
LVQAVRHSDSAPIWEYPITIFRSMPLVTPPELPPPWEPPPAKAKDATAITNKAVNNLFITSS